MYDDCFPFEAILVGGSTRSHPLVVELEDMRNTVILQNSEKPFASQPFVKDTSATAVIRIQSCSEVLLRLYHRFGLAVVEWRAG